VNVDAIWRSFDQKCKITGNENVKKSLLEQSMCDWRAVQPNWVTW